MARRDTRIRIDEDGRLEVVDPGFESVGLLQEIDPEFRVRTAVLSDFSSPRFLRTRRTGSGLSFDALKSEPLQTLWAIHGSTVDDLRNSVETTDLGEEGASLLDLKIEIARRILMDCHLCAHRCGVNRTQGEQGVCRLGSEAIVAEHFVHIAEESPINPSLVLNLAGCALRCKFCQQSALLNPFDVDGELLNEATWKKLCSRGARSLSFVGGNPDESIYAILRFLRGAESTWRLPLVWNCHAYATEETVALLDGIVDAFLPDLKYLNDACGRGLSAVPNYPEVSKVALTSMLRQEVPVIVRILVLPGHFDCCHAPALDFLAAIKGKDLLVSVRDQYSPDWKIRESDGELSRRTTAGESDAVRSYAVSRGLTLVD